jgi:multiple sugar transport system permease protein|uniref:Sugar ABC transporter permease n=1 Tax=Anaerolinea thermolimosa TaxID=229919 RepID=A0A7C4PKG3_9CHLR
MAQFQITSPSPAPQPRQRFRLTMRKREALMGYVFLSPWILGFLIFLAGPMLASIYLSLTNYKMIQPPQWIGLANYERMFTDPFVATSLRVTTIFTALSVPLSIVLALSVALLLNQKIVASGVFRTIFYLPSLISGVAVAIVFAWIFNYRFGILNYLLSLVGVDGPNWLGHPRYALWAFIIMSLWGIGGNVIIYLAGLQGVPVSLHEAAKIDGANAWYRFWNITLPLITPVLLFTLIMGVIGTFQTFTSSYIMTGGGPANATLFYLLYLYRNAFNWFEMGYASALAWLLFIIILTCTLILWSTSARWVYYEGNERN